MFAGGPIWLQLDCTVLTHYYWNHVIGSCARIRMLPVGQSAHATELLFSVPASRYDRANLATIGLLSFNLLLLEVFELLLG